MASTNEDATVLASGRLDDGEVLIARQLSDRGTIEIALWRGGADGLVQQAPALEIAAEPDELAALLQLCEAARAAAWEAASDGVELARSQPLKDGACLVAMRDGDRVVLARRPERDDLIRLSRPALDLLAAELLPKAARKLADLGAPQP